MTSLPIERIFGHYCFKILNKCNRFRLFSCLFVYDCFFFSSIFFFCCSTIFGQRHSENYLPKKKAHKCSSAAARNTQKKKTPYAIENSKVLGKNICYIMVQVLSLLPCCTLVSLALSRIFVDTCTHSLTLATLANVYGNMCECLCVSDKNL